MDDGLRSVLSSDTQKSIEGLVRADLERFVNKFGYTLVKLTQVEKPKELPSVKKVEKAKRKKTRNKVEIPEVFGRKFPSVAKLSEYFSVTQATVYYWIEKGHDIEQKLKEKGKLPEKVDGVLIKRKQNGDRIWK